MRVNRRREIPTIGPDLYERTSAAHIIGRITEEGQPCEDPLLFHGKRRTAIDQNRHGESAAPFRECVETRAGALLAATEHAYMSLGFDDPQAFSFAVHRLDGMVPAIALTSIA